MEINEVLNCMSGTGCGREQTDIARQLIESGQTDELIRLLKVLRCGLIEEMHDSQKKVDLMDKLIYHIEKERKN